MPASINRCPRAGGRDKKTISYFAWCTLSKVKQVILKKQRGGGQSQNPIFLYPKSPVVKEFRELSYPACHRIPAAMLDASGCGAISHGPPGLSRVLKKPQLILGWGAVWLSVCPLMVTNGSHNQRVVIILHKNMQISEPRLAFREHMAPKTSL